MQNDVFDPVSQEFEYATANKTISRHKSRNLCRLIGPIVASVVVVLLTGSNSLAQGLIESSKEDLEKEEKQLHATMHTHAKSSCEYLKAASKLGAVLIIERNFSSAKSLYSEVLRDGSPPSDIESRRLWAKISLDAGLAYQTTDAPTAEKFFLDAATIYQQLEGLDSEPMLEALLEYGKSLTEQHKYPRVFYQYRAESLAVYGGDG